MNDGWYAVYTKHQHEKSVASLLMRKGFDVFLPVYQTLHRWQDRNQLVVLPLFPCYLFLRGGLDRKLDIFRTAGVRALVENGGHACDVPEAEIQALRKICFSGTRVQPHSFLKQGDHVRIRSGPLAGTEGIFIREKNLYRVVVSIELLRQGVSVEIDLKDVEPSRDDRRFHPSPLETLECRV